MKPTTLITAKVVGMNTPSKPLTGLGLHDTKKLNDSLPGAKHDTVVITPITAKHGTTDPTSVSPKRVLLVSEHFPPSIGGSGRYLWELLRRLPSDRVVVAAGRCTGDEEFDAKHANSISRLRMALRETGTISCTGFAGYFRLAMKINDMCRREQISALWCGRCVTEGWIGWLVHQWTGLPYIVSAHGEDLKLPVGAAVTGVMTSRQHRWMARRILRQAIGVVANCENTRQIVISEWGVPASRVHVLTPGVDTNYFKPAQPCPRVRARLNWTDRTVILSVGRLQRRKGHDHMILALPQIRKQIPDVLYAVMGDGVESASLKALVKEKGLENYVQFYGEMDQHTILQAFQQCDLFALPNRQVGSDIEGFGIVLLEAQACGRPVLAGQSGGTAETMSVPHTGITVDCTNPDTLATAVLELLFDPKRLDQMGDAAREWAVSRFDWDRMAERTVKLVSQLMATPIVASTPV